MKNPKKTHNPTPTTPTNNTRQIDDGISCRIPYNTIEMILATNIHGRIESRKKNEIL